MGYPGSICKEGHDTIYFQRYDAHACVICDVWVDANCKDITCVNCKDRPDKPSQIREEKNDKSSS